MRTLDTPTIRALEDLIIDAIYLDILRGKLDQKAQQLEVEYTMGRDLAPGQLNGVLSALQNWCAVPASILSHADFNSRAHAPGRVRLPVFSPHSTRNLALSRAMQLCAPLLPPRTRPPSQSV